MITAIPVLNKTYADSSPISVPLSTTTRSVFETKEFVIQAGKAFNLTIQHVFSPIVGGGSDWSGLYVGASMRVNDVWYDMGHSGYTVGMSLGGLRPERYYDTKYIDLITDNIVPSDASYRVVITIRNRTYGGTGATNAPVALINNGDGNRGIEIQELILQNNTSVIIQEKDL